MTLIEQKLYFHYGCFLQYKLFFKYCSPFIYFFSINEQFKFNLIITIQISLLLFRFYSK